MADERRLQLVEVVEEDEETVRVLGLYSRFESLLILSYLKRKKIQITKKKIDVFLSNQLL